MSQTATLLITGKDQKGLVYRISEFVFRHQGNILHADHHIDFETGLFLSRVEWDLDDFRLAPEEMTGAVQALAEELEMRWELRFSDRPLRVAIFVSRFDHCLIDLLHRHAIGELPASVVAIFSNHPELQPVANRYGIPFHLFPITAASKAAQEERELALLAALRVDLVVLARYMQVLSAEFVARYPNRLINIHHSFLPAFSGARPYAQAHARGVKIIGATSHYVTAVVDEGPIIEQDTIRVSHRDTVEDLVRKGRDLERIVLAQAVLLHLQGRVLPCGSRTVVFD
ncbi:MAG TPA: formyltetrahydrofolate deformylase [Methylomirabilota bacterium]|nr:formyltetrahydrofolate deformylase [Methylomirabilota bacterium]